MMLPTKVLEDVEGWDSVANGGARDLLDMFGTELPIEDLSTEDDQLVRPADFDAWRKMVNRDAFPNRRRYDNMLDLMERDSTLMLRVSR